MVSTRRELDLIHPQSGHAVAPKSRASERRCELNFASIQSIMKPARRVLLCFFWGKVPELGIQSGNPGTTLLLGKVPPPKRQSQKNMIANQESGKA